MFISRKFRFTKVELSEVAELVEAGLVPRSTPHAHPTVILVDLVEEKYVPVDERVKPFDSVVRLNKDFSEFSLEELCRIPV